MREDMDRVLVGRPRGGARLRLKRCKRHQNPCRWPDDTLRREPMSHGRGTKYLNENLAPLERYLRSQLGRPWDEVYSEICGRLRPTSAVQQHVRDHLQDYVAVRTRLEGRRVLGHTRWSALAVLNRPGHGFPHFYVGPLTGLLRERPRKRWRRCREQLDPDVRWDGPWRQLRRIGGVWYAFHLAPLPDAAGEQAQLRDRFLGRPLPELAGMADALVAAYGRPGVFAAEKRQLSKRELRRIDGLPKGRKRVDPR